MKFVFVESEMIDINEIVLLLIFVFELMVCVMLLKLRVIFFKLKENKGLGNLNYNGFEVYNLGELMF